MQRGRGGRRGRGDRGDMGRGRAGRGDRGRGRGGGGGGGRSISAAQGQEAIHNALSGLSLRAAQPQTVATGQLARRPDAGGRAGRPFRVLANFFQLKAGIQTVYHYDVDTKPKEGRRVGEGDVVATGPQLLPIKLCRAIITACAEGNNWRPCWTYDGRKNIYASEEFLRRQRSTFEVNMGSAERPRVFEVGIQWASTINMLDIQRFLQDGNVPLPREALQSLEVCLKFSAANRPGSYLAGRSVFLDGETGHPELTETSEIWTGYHQGIKLCQQGLMINVETTCGAFYKRQPVLDFMQAVLGTSLAEMRRIRPDRLYRDMSAAIANMLVQVTHRRDESKKFRCRGVTRNPASQEKFARKDGTELTVEQYWREKYGPMRHPWLPCLDVSKGRKLNFLPMEVCEIVPGQRILRMTEDQTRKMIRFTATRPDERKQQIQRTLQEAGIGQDPAAQTFRIQINPEMIQAPARILPQPCLQYQQPPCMDTGDRGAWNLEHVKFFRPGTIRSWVVVSSMDRATVLRPGEMGLPAFMESLMNMLTSMGIAIPQGRCDLVHKGTMTTEATLKEAIGKAEQMYGTRPDIVLYLLPSKDALPYQEVKRIAERDLGIVTQCFVAASAGIGHPTRGRAQYLANLAMKINHKVGGVNTRMVPANQNIFPVLGPAGNRPFIVLGADVTHPPPSRSDSDAGESSVGAVVASMDQYLGQFAARVMTMERGEEKMPMHTAIVELFRQFYTRTKVRPEAVFFYRDGVSEGQFEDVLEHEYGEIKKACNTLDPSYNPPITLVVVQKSHHTRLFPVQQADGDRNGNIKPGTCVDTCITSKYEFDFYLNSHAGIQGTNKPAHYYVLVDENGMGSDGMQLFTYWMCYLYCRCTRSVSYAPPAYYAHLAAMHGRYLVDQRSDSTSEGSNGEQTSIFHADLSQRMFFV